jgi:hypothetical protein
VPEPVRVGAVSIHQGSGEPAHAAEPARRDPDLSTSATASCTT